jgi:predicted nucleic acid-binding protein
MTFHVSAQPIVLDASVAVEFLDADTKWVGLFNAWATGERQVLVPSLFLAEVANGHLRGKRTTAAEIARRLDRLITAGVEIADRGLPGLIEAIGLADQHGLTVYDALYLQLALDVDGELATLDADLRRAAESEQLSVIG